MEASEIEDLRTWLIRFLDSGGRVVTYPAKRSRQAIVLAYLATKFDRGRTYSEKEVNALLGEWHLFNDWALLRRDLFDAGYLDRSTDGTDYRATDKCFDNPVFGLQLSSD